MTTSLKEYIEILNKIQILTEEIRQELIADKMEEQKENKDYFIGM